MTIPKEPAFHEYDWPLTIFYSEWTWKYPEGAQDGMLAASLEGVYGPGTGTLAQTIRFLGSASRYFGWSVTGDESPGFRIFNDPIVPLALNEEHLQLLGDFRYDSAVAREAYGEARSAAVGQKDDFDYFEFALDRFDAMGDLVECRHLMAQKDEESRETVVDLLEELADSTMDLQERYDALWRRPRRPKDMKPEADNFENLLESIEAALDAG